MKSSLTTFWSEYEKKKNTLLLYFFASNPNMKSELINSDFQNLTFLWKMGYFRPIFRQNFFFEFDFQYLFSVKNETFWRGAIPCKWISCKMTIPNHSPLLLPSGQGSMTIFTTWFLILQVTSLDRIWPKSNPLWSSYEEKCIFGVF